MRRSLICIPLLTVLVSLAGCNENKSSKNSAKTQEFKWEESDSTLRFSKGSDLVWQYNFNNRFGKPYFHPLQVNNINLSWESPADHTWHLGLWFSWKFINELNYWEYMGGHASEKTGFRSEGVTDIENIEIKKNEDFYTNICLAINYHPQDGETIMNESRNITIAPPAEDGSYYIDYSFSFSSAGDDVLIDRTPLEGEPGGQSWGGYSGMSIRFNQDLGDSIMLIPESIKPGSKDDFMYIGFITEKGTAGLAILCNPDYSTPSTGWYITTNPGIPFNYFSPSALYDKNYLLKKGETLTLKYRVWILPGKVSEDDLKNKLDKYIQ